MEHIAKQDENLYINSMGKKFRVRGIFTTDEAANEFCASHRDVGVIAVHGPFIFVANFYEGEQQ